MYRYYAHRSSEQTSMHCYYKYYNTM